MRKTRDLPAMDWTKVNLPAPKNARPQVGELATLDYWKLVIAAKLLKKSLAATLQTAVYTYVQRNWEENERRLGVEAAALGITPEELFEKLANEDIKQ